VTADPLFDLTGKRALVTGGSRGLGREIVRAFAENGADVAIVSRKLDNCETLSEEIGAKHGHRTLAIACNVSDWTACDTLADRVIHEWGGIDVLVNNAGMSPLYESVEDITEALWDKVLAVNLKGPFRLATRFGSDMARSGGGSIINVSSLAAVRATADVVPYAAAKAGLNNLTESLAAAFGPTVRVNTIMPGRFATDISAAWDADAVAASVAGHALQRVAEPHEIVGAALFFASDASSFCTGSILKIDGGVP
jgi:NAD(P)-dependent dehydrogenase (short-subunit alcohol dehydrogenase family)